MRAKINRISKYIGVGVILSFLLPVIKMGGIGFKPDLIFLLIAVPILAMGNKVNDFSISVKYKVILILLLISMMISNNIGGSAFMNNYKFSIPTEFYQMFSRLTIFVFFAYLGYYNIIKTKSFIYIVSIVFICGLVFGVIQSLGIPFVDNISLNYYAITDQQIKGFSSLNFRGFGTSGNILTWGGLCILCFYFFYYLTPNFLIKISGIVLSIFNILLTASRSALFALGLSFIIMYFYENVIIKKKYRAFISSMFGVLLFLFLFYRMLALFFPERIELMEIRLLQSEEDLTESSRGAQIDQFINFLNKDVLNYVFGIGKDVLNSMGYMEVEPIFILSAYGIVGVVLHYITVYFLFKEVLKYKGKSKSFYFLMSLIVSMMIFSLGYFFFREAYSGLVFWWLSGYFIGVLFKEKEFTKMNNLIEHSIK